MPELRLVIFDVDGTLVDSEADINAAMAGAYASIGQPCPTPQQVRQIVGLSLEEAFAQLSPELGAQRHDLAQAYRDAYAGLRIQKGAAESSPLFPGAREAIERLRADPWTLLAVATGKSKRGLDKLIEAHDLEEVFVSRQVSDFHPSKPHPSMLLTILEETGVDASRAVMVGDTTFDMDMARAARMATIGVTWGYHAAALLGADRLIDRFQELPDAVDALITPDNGHAT